MNRWSRQSVVTAVVAIAAVALALASPAAPLVVTVYTNFRNRQEISRELRSRYPSATCHVKTAVTDTTLWVLIPHMPDPHQRAEVRQWLADWKAQRGTDVRIVLY